jgi:hypothetical protein
MNVMKDDVDYKKFCGKIEDNFSKMVGSGYDLASVSDLMDVRIFGKLRNFPIVTGSSVVYASGKEKGLKIMRSPEYFRNFLNNNKVVDNRIYLSDSEFEDLSGNDILYVSAGKRDDLLSDYYFNFNFLDEIKDSELWNFLSKENSRLVRYLDVVRESVQRRGEDKGMWWSNNVGDYGRFGNSLFPVFLTSIDSAPFNHCSNVGHAELGHPNMYFFGISR